MSGRCVQCGRGKAVHLDDLSCPGLSTKYASMDLPEGRTCSDCAWFRFCSKFLGPEVALNSGCDWYPVRFIPLDKSIVATVQEAMV
jgi:hypothetical protein